MTGISMQDWLALMPRYYTRPALEETINDPTNPNHYWRWRMQSFIEDLLADRQLIGLIQNLVSSSGRTVRPMPRAV
jgi:4-alpha-glucanotransferase